MGRKSKVKVDENTGGGDPTAWILENDLAQFLLMHTTEIKYMVMFGYTYMHGCKVFSKVPASAPLSYKFMQMVFACTGGGILIPVFINAIPVPLCTDSYPIAIMISTLLHIAFPIVRDVVKLSSIVKVMFIILYEIMRAYVVVRFTSAASVAIAPSEFSFPLFGPIMCGTISGCGGAFLPLDKGLGPLKDNGLAPNMMSAFIGATFFHLFMNFNNVVVNAKQKAQVGIVIFFILFNIINEFDVVSSIFGSSAKKEEEKEDAKGESKKTK